MPGAEGLRVLRPPEVAQEPRQDGCLASTIGDRASLGQIRLNRQRLHFSQISPPERVYDVMLECRM